MTPSLPVKTSIQDDNDSLFTVYRRQRQQQRQERLQQRQQQQRPTNLAGEPLASPVADADDDNSNNNKNAKSPSLGSPISENVLISSPNYNTTTQRGNNHQGRNVSSSSANAGKQVRQRRLIALDIMRGLTVILMIIVNNQVGPETWWPLEHATWNGLTPTDFVFPWFLFIMGYAIAITFRNLPEYAFVVQWRARFREYFDPEASSSAQTRLYASKKFLSSTTELETSSEKSSLLAAQQNAAISPSPLTNTPPQEAKKKFLYLFPVTKSTYSKLHMWIKIFRRTILLYLIGFFANCIVVTFNFTQVRILGVLQRISLVYFFTTLVVVLVPTTGLQVLLVFFLHGVYFAFMKFFPVPPMPLNGGSGDLTVDCGRNVVTPQCSAESFFDTHILTTAHTYRHATFDPEGLLSTLSSISTAYFGVIFYRLSAMVQRKFKKDKQELETEIHSEYLRGAADEDILQEEGTPAGTPVSVNVPDAPPALLPHHIDSSLRSYMLYKMVAIWILFGSVLVLLGHSIHALDIFPYNKSVWSTSFVLTTAGCAGITLGLITFVSDIMGWQRIWPQLPLWVGSNPLALYVLPEYLQIAVKIIHINGTPLRIHLYNILFASWLGWCPKLANFAYGFCFELMFIPLAAFLYWKKIYIKL